MRSIHFDPDAWQDFLFWLASDRKTARRITRLIAEIQRDPFNGIGKPEPSKASCRGTGPAASTTSIGWSIGPSTTKSGSSWPDTTTDPVGAQARQPTATPGCA